MKLTTLTTVDDAETKFFISAPRLRRGIFVFRCVLRKRKCGKNGESIQHTGCFLVPCFFLRRRQKAVENFVKNVYCAGKQKSL